MKNWGLIVNDKNGIELLYALSKNDLYFLKTSNYVTKCEVHNNSVNFSGNQIVKVDVNELCHEKFCQINSEYVVNQRNQ